MMLKLLQRSKMSLAFHLMVEPEEVRPRAADFVTSRWFESLAAGCIILGRRPPGGMAAEMFDWPNALVDLPDRPSEATDFVKSLACDESFLQKARIRNVAEMCRRHDWRYRILDIYNHFDLSLPEKLKAEIAALGAMAKKIDGYINLQVPAGQANPSLPIGPALGQRGLSIMEFCKQFNAKTQAQQGLVIPVIITVYKDRSFTFITKTPPAAILLKKAAGVEKASGVPNRTKVGKVSKQQVREIAELKAPDLNSATVEAAERMVMGTARSMGIEIAE